MPRLHNACVVHSSYSLCISCQICGENSLASPIPTVWVLEMLATTTARKKQLIGICSKQPLHEMEILVKDCAQTLPPSLQSTLPLRHETTPPLWAAGAKPGQGQRGKAAWGVSQAGSRRKVRQGQMQTGRHEGSRDRREGSAKEVDFEFCTSKTSVALESSVFLTL